MKKFIYILTIAVLMTSCSSSKNGIKLTGFYYNETNYWQNQANKIVHRNQRFAKMEACAAKKEDKMMKNILAAKAKEKQKNKKYLAATFDFH